MSFVKLKGSYEPIIYAPIKGQADSFAGKYGLGVKHSTIFSPEEEQRKLFKVIPERYWPDFQMTRMAINSLLLPHVDNDFITTINFYFEPHDYRTIFYGVKTGASSFKALEEQNIAVGDGHLVEEDIDGEELKHRVKEFVAERKNMPTCEEVTYVDAIYSFDDVYEIGSFVAQPKEAYMLDVRLPHSVEPLNGPKLRKALALRTKKYDFKEVYEMLQETGTI
jgi:hypothetical protein